MMDQTYDPMTGFFHYDIQGYCAGEMSGMSNNLFLSLTPRWAIRRDLGRRHSVGPHVYTADRVLTPRGLPRNGSWRSPS